jgi:hypothetical protein
MLPSERCGWSPGTGATLRAAATPVPPAVGKRKAASPIVLRTNRPSGLLDPR